MDGAGHERILQQSEKGTAAPLSEQGGSILQLGRQFPVEERIRTGVLLGKIVKSDEASRRLGIRTTSSDGAKGFGSRGVRW